MRLVDVSIWAVAMGASALLAQIPDEIPSGVSAMTATGILGWYAWYTTSRTVPEAQKAHQGAVDSLVQKLADIVSGNQAVIKEIIKEHKDADAKARQEYLVELAAERSDFSRMLTEAGKNFMNVLNIFDHRLRGIAQQALSAKELSEIEHRKRAQDIDTEGDHA